MIKSMVLGLLVFVLTVTAAYLDEPLSSDAQAMLASVPERTTHRAVLYRAGLGAPEGVDPLLYGRYMLLGTQIHSTSQSPRPLQSIEFQRLRSPKGRLFCSVYEDAACWSAIASVTPKALSALETDHATLLHRYETWLSLSDPDKLISLTPEDSLPTDHISGAHRLITLRAFLEAQQGQTNKALQQLQDIISRLRSHLALGDDFPAKLLIADLIDESLQALSVISHTHRVKGPPMSPLTAEERDLSPAMARQFRKAHDFFLSIDRLGTPDDATASTGPLAPSRLNRFVYKPRHSLNRTYQTLSFWAGASQVSPAALPQLLETRSRRNFLARTWDHLRNPLGQTLRQLTEPDFKAQIVRMQQLDIAIALFNATHAQALEDLRPESLANPYGTGASPVLSANRSTLCMPIPEVIDDKAVCLRLGV